MSQFVPEWKGAIEGYVVNQLNKHYWKVQRTQQREDVMQEAYLVFLRCRRRYTEVTEAKHFMALFKTAWYHRFTDLANEDTQSRIVGEMPVSEDGMPYEAVGELDNDGALLLLIEQAPAEIRMVLSLFLNAPQELLDGALGAFREQRHARGASLRLNALLGLPTENDTIGKVLAYFH